MDGGFLATEPRISWCSCEELSLPIAQSVLRLHWRSGVSSGIHESSCHFELLMCSLVVGHWDSLRVGTLQRSGVTIHVHHFLISNMGSFELTVVTDLMSAVHPGTLHLFGRALHECKLVVVMKTKER